MANVSKQFRRTDEAAYRRDNPDVLSPRRMEKMNQGMDMYSQGVEGQPRLFSGSRGQALGDTESQMRSTEMDEYGRKKRRMGGAAPSVEEMNNY